MHNTFRRAGFAAILLLATLASERTEGLLADGETTAVALNAGFHLAYAIAAALAGVALVLAVILLRPPRALASGQEASRAGVAYAEGA